MENNPIAAHAFEELDDIIIIREGGDLVKRYRDEGGGEL